MGSLFWGSGSAQVANGVNTQGGLYALLKSITTLPSSPDGRVYRKRPPP
jgi:hypothetical protein